MRKRRGLAGGLGAAFAGVLLAIGSAATVAAAPPQSHTEKSLYLRGDFDFGVAVLVNIDRATYCTPDRVAFEEAVLAWLDGGAVGDPPQAPEDPQGFGNVTYFTRESRQGAVATSLLGVGLYAEIWKLDDDAAGIGACTDTDDAMTRIGAGTAVIGAYDNDSTGSGTRPRAFGNSGAVTVRDAKGHRHSYSWIFTFDDGCRNAPCIVNKAWYR